ncbi:MAG TPA: PEP-CTERM sorting domain-containing protein [Thiobacillaceae bacterium]|nr:PEP-CTERM sorting domain-containing protein [Thiobacillaceae bacterium]HNU62900.1 PEP-CTERM sorting domain-containing protein [Thiobacillaceae bacterium]
MKTQLKPIAIAALIASAALAGQAQAIPVTIAGSTVSFTFDDALTGMFGTPTVTGDLLYFTPTTFIAQSANGAGFDIANQTVNIKVTANAGHRITGASLSEAGDYYNINTNFAGFEGVGVGGQFIARDMDAPGTNYSISSIMASAPTTATVASLQTFSTTGWSASASAGMMGWGGDGVDITLQNILIASSLNPASAAFIEKKYAGIGLTTVPVPEAETYAMFLAGLGIIGFLARRRTAVK